jgi:hypothetical protein
VSPSATACNDAMAALAMLQLDGAITGWRTNFIECGSLGWAPRVSVTIAADDELAIERTRRAVRQVLQPHIKGVEVTVEPGFLLVGGPADRFDFSPDDKEEP